ncbi:MAG TPA: cytochrome oxidase small assembly protein [Caldimonas sp.]|nr:cytochrome oxidase small assembly protein [Caldimonas sp.]
MTPEQQRANRRLGWILATIAIAFFIGFIARGALFGF